MKNISPADAKKWVEWADSTDPETVRRWIEVRPGFDENKIRKMATSKASQVTSAVDQYLTPDGPQGAPLPKESARNAYMRNIAESVPSLTNRPPAPQEAPMTPDEQSQRNYQAVLEAARESGYDPDPSLAKDLAMQFGSGVVEGAANVLGAPEAIQRVTEKGGRWAAEKMGADPDMVSKAIDYTTIRMPDAQSIQDAMTLGYGLPEAQTSLGKGARDIGRIATEVVPTPMSAANKVGVGGSMLLGGELGEWIGGDSGRQVGELIPSLLAPTTGRAVGGLAPNVTRTGNAERRIGNTVTRREINDIANSASDVEPAYRTTRLQNLASEVIPGTTNPDATFKNLTSFNEADNLIDQISRREAQLRGEAPVNMQYRTERRRELYEPIDTPSFKTKLVNDKTLIPVEYPDGSVKQMTRKQRLREIFQKDQYLQGIVDGLKKEGQDMNTLENIYKGNPSKKSTFTVNAKQADTFLSEATSVIQDFKDKNPKKYKRAKDKLDEIQELLGDADLKKARDYAGREFALEQGKAKLEKILQKPETAETDIDTVLREMGITDDKALKDIGEAIFYAQGKTRVINKTKSGANVGSATTTSERKSSEAIASLIAGLKKRALYLTGQAVVGKRFKEYDMEVNDLILEALLKPEHPIWEKLAKEQKRSALGATAVTGGSTLANDRESE